MAARERSAWLVPEPAERVTMPAGLPRDWHGECTPDDMSLPSSHPSAPSTEVVSSEPALAEIGEASPLSVAVDDAPQSKGAWQLG